jgi:hypothetical protein
MQCDLNSYTRGIALFLLPYAKFDVVRWIEELMPSSMVSERTSITGMMSKL